MSISGVYRRKKTYNSCLSSLGCFASILIWFFLVLVIYHMMLETLFPNLSFKFIVLTSILKCVDINFTMFVFFFLNQVVLFD